MGQTELRSRWVQWTPYELTISILAYLWLLGGLGFGIYYGSKVKPLRKETLPSDAVNAATLYVLCVLTIVAVVATYGTSLNIAKNSASKAINAADNPFMGVLSWATVVIVGYALTTRPLKLPQIVFRSLIAAIVVFPDGVRMQLIAIVIAFGYALVRQGRKVGRTAFLAFLFVPLVVGLTAMRFFLRATAWYHGTADAYLNVHGGFLGIIFGSDEISTAAIFPQFLLNNFMKISRWPGEMVMAILLYPVPRAMAGDIKPLPVSSEFTIFWSPNIFKSSRSELVIGAMAEAVSTYGVILGAFWLAAVGYYAIRLFVRHSGGERQSLFGAFVVAIGLLLFVRDETFTVGLWIWAVMIGLGIRWCMNFYGTLLPSKRAPRRQMLRNEAAFNPEV
jgi:hypothetical protein